VLSALKSAASTWRSIDLESRRSSIDSSALAMADEDSRAQSARKALAEQTKAWKRLATDAERAAQLGPLVRAYQEEVNQLTRRSTASEAAFLQLYRLLLDAPDPFRLLSAAIAQLDALSGTEDALRLARQTLSEFEAEFAGLKNQDVTIRRLEAEKKELETNVRSIVATQVALRARESEQALLEAKQSFEERERQLEARLEGYKDQLSMALASQSSLAAAALSRDRVASEKAEQAAQGDVRWLESEVERQSFELGRKDQELAALRAELAAVTAGGGGHTLSHSYPRTPGSATPAGAAAQSELDRAHFEEESAALLVRAETAEALCATLQQQVSSLRATLSTTQSETSATVESLQATVTALRAEVSASLSNRDAKEEVEELRRQLRALQEIQYGSRSADADADAEGGEGEQPGGTTTAAGASSSSSSIAGSAATPSSSSNTSTSAPSQVLLSKARRLESELTSLKLSHSALQSSHSTLLQEHSVSSLALEDARQLLARLEDELAQATAAAAGRIATTTAALAATAATGGSLHAHPPPNFHPSAAPTSPLITAVPAAAAGLFVDTGASPAYSSVLGGGGSGGPSSFSTAAASPAAAAAPLSSSALHSALAQAQSMLTIVLAQRDRYRSKAEAVEASAAQALADAARLRDQCAQLKKDNVALYEKLQFVKSFGGGAGAAAAAGGASMTSGGRASGGQDYGGGGDEEVGLGGVGSGALTRSSLPGGSSADDGAGGSSSVSESKYAQLYEARLNPFTLFKRRARLEREAALSVSERWTLALGRALFSRQSARKALFAYAAALHLLIVIVLWNESIGDHCSSGASRSGGATFAAAGKGLPLAHPH
jgi:homeobox protein cut-like